MTFKLFVDDVRPIPPGWVGARTVEQAMTYLATGNVEYASLDHDLGACAVCQAEHKDVGNMLTPETTFCYWCPHAPDGSTLVRWIIETGNWPKHRPTVHSMNPVGRMRMMGLIETYWPKRTEYWENLPDRKVVCEDFVE
jgi:hypothetical protein